MIQQVAKKLNIQPSRVKSVIELLKEGNTVPFIARYRKEQTGSLDEVQIKAIEDTYAYSLQLEERKKEVLASIEEQGKLTSELKQSIEQATVLQRVEDIYRPYRKKRQTRATKAIERGLEPIAKQWLAGEHVSSSELAHYIQEDKDVHTIEEVLSGARDIVAEHISDQLKSRQVVRKWSKRQAMLRSEKKKDAVDEKSTYQIYYDYEEPITKAAHHRILAMNRGEKEDILRVSVQFPEEKILDELNRIYIVGTHSETKKQLTLAIEDGMKRLLLPSVERELRNEKTEEAEQQAIRVFAENLRSLLLQPPLKGQTVLSIDPAFRTGCKLAVVDELGALQEIDVIYPHPPHSKKKESEEKLLHLIEKYNEPIIAIGNGTASRETEQFVAALIQKYKIDTGFVIVNEAGASVYSASEEARDEFPDLQVEERSAVSIARRLQDPLSELVKIDPASLGVGQYQHDVKQKELQESLNFVVETAVNRVGVDVNTASVSLLQHVSGLSKAVAKNIVAYREEHGAYTNRKQLKKVKRLGAKTYEQAIGFLRIRDGEEPLDATGIHPESYEVAEALLQVAGLTKEDIGTERAEELRNIPLKEWSAKSDIGEETMKDIVEILLRPTRDVRDEFPQPVLQSNVLSLDDLHPGMKLQGTVRNVVDFGAFVDIGVTEDGLIHISKLSNRYIKHPLEVVASGDIVTVWVEAVDKEKGRISLTKIKPEK